MLMLREQLQCRVSPPVVVDRMTFLENLTEDDGTSVARGCRMRGMTAIDPRVSFAELETFEDYNGLLRYELYEGELIVLTGPFVRHQGVVSELANLLGTYRQAHGGWVSCASPVVLSEHDVFLPDVVWIAQRRLQLIENLDSPISVVPDLAIEVISRSTGARDRGRKKTIFAKHGLPEYWLIEPVAKTLEICAHDGGRLDLVGYYTGEDEVTSPTLPDLRFRVDQLFRDPRSR
jgi:Uma2 family endonuclease